MGTTECSQPTSKSSWDSQDFGDISMVLKMAHFRKSTGPRWVKQIWKWNIGTNNKTKIRQSNYVIFPSKTISAVGHPGYKYVSAWNNNRQ